MASLAVADSGLVISEWGMCVCVCVCVSVCVSVSVRGVRGVRGLVDC